MGDISGGDTKPLALVVDDDAYIRIDMANMLGQLGFAVSEADCVSSALAYLQEQGDSVSVLLTDLHMPGSRNGATLANHVSYMWPHIRILVTSGMKQPVAGELPQTAQFIPKPLTAGALCAYVSGLPPDVPPQQTA